MDIKKLHRAIKDLRAELERVNLAIQQIEAVAEAASQEQATNEEAPEPEPRPDREDE